MAKIKALLKTIANVFSMVAVPSSVLRLPSNPYDVSAWILLGVGLAIQFIKYFAEYYLEEVVE
mgnify:CR=1 FL=1